MNATKRVAQAGIKFAVGQTVSIPSFSLIDHELKNGDYVILNGSDLSIYDVASNRMTAEVMAGELGDDGEGYVAVEVTNRGQAVQQYWRDVVADCWGLQN